MKIGIVTDSTCDLPVDLIHKYGILVIPLYIHIGQEGFLDGIEITRESFYQQLPGLNPAPTTAAPGIDAFIVAYDQLAEAGAEEIISIHMSLSLSAMVDVARVAASQYQRVPVTVFDSGQLSLGTGFLVLEAAQAAQEGKSMPEILSRLQEKVTRTHVFAALDTLEFLVRSGRMNGVVAGLGSILQLKPLLKMFNGVPGAERVRTWRRAENRLIGLIKGLHPLEQIALVHTHAPEKAAELLEKVRDLLPSGDILSVDITPVIGAHIGPGAVGFACVTARSRQAGD